MTRGRWVALLVMLLAGYYAWRGGLFTSAGFKQLERDAATSTVRLARLRHEIDSMRAFRDSLTTSPVVQERVARIQWGMIRDGELSFMVRVRDSVKADSGK